MWYAWIILKPPASTPSSSWENCLPQNQSLVPKRLGTTDLLNFCCCCCWVTSVVSDSVRPHRRQPIRHPRPWDSPGKNTGVGCHFPLQCMKVKSESEVTQSCPTLSDAMDCSLPGSSVHGIFQARVLEWGAIAFSGGEHLGNWSLARFVSPLLTPFPSSLPGHLYLLPPSYLLCVTLWTSLGVPCCGELFQH